MLCIPHVKTNTFGQCCFFLCSKAVEFSSLPTDSHHIQSSHAFKTALETHLCKQYHNLFQILPSLGLSQQSRNAYPSPKQFTYPASRWDFFVYGQLHGAQTFLHHHKKRKVGKINNMQMHIQEFNITNKINIFCLNCFTLLSASPKQ